MLLRAAIFAALVATLAAPSSADDPPRGTLEEEIAAAVGLPTPKARAAAASAIAGRADVTLPLLLEAMRSFGTFAKQDPGLHHETAPLQVGDKVETTELHVFVPASYDPAKPAPLLLFFHGAKGDGSEAFPPWQPWGERLGMLIVAPTEAGPNEGFKSSDRERWSALAVLRWARRRFNVDENRVHLTGGSRGGHMTWDVGLRFPDLFASLTPMIGGPRLRADHGGNNLRFLENVLDVPIRDLQGSKDHPMLLFDLHLAFKKLDAWKARDAKLIEFADRGHDFDFTAVDWGTFLPSAVRDPAPSRVLRRATKPSEGRAFWAEIAKVAPFVVDDVAPIAPPEWKSMTEDAQRLFIEDAAEKATARLSVKRTDVGKFEAVGTGVVKFRLLLSDGMFDPAKPVTVSWNGQAVTHPVRPSKATLLAEFVERFDRTFLPVVEVQVP